MKYHKQIKEAARLAKLYCVSNGEKFRLQDQDPGDTGEVKDEEHSQTIIEDRAGLLSHLQEKLYAQDRWGLLIILQGMDAAGKDGVVKHVMSGINPEGCDVHSFKTPSTEELNHDYLWRAHSRVPGRGMIGIFNRSYFEEVLVARVHSTILEAQKLPEKLITKHIWEHRYQDINSFEQYLTRNGVVVRKFFLHLSKKEQKRRFLDRLEDPKKNWKFSMDDVKERGYWKDYQEAYEKMIQSTSTKHAPWYVVPADNKWYSQLIVASAIITALDELDLSFPHVDKKKKTELETVRKSLQHEKKSV
ncbi:MAG: polyphosphate kinase 2 family protein [Candidatus Acidiferrum sp.]|jgi:PPK2 family polyphosphate:nucleotide phosphotransferase